MKKSTKDIYLKYLRAYIKEITKAHKSYHISICDIEEDVFLNFDINDLKLEEDITIIKTDNERLDKVITARNKVTINKIIVITENGIKHNDSLKDFMEYSITSFGLVHPMNSNLLVWKSLKQSLGDSLTDEICEYLNRILLNKNLLLSDIIIFIKTIIKIKQRDSYTTSDIEKIIIKNLFKNLHLIKCWSSDIKLSKTQLTKLVRVSDLYEINSRLEKIVANEKILQSMEVVDRTNIEKMYDLFRKKQYEKLFKMNYPTLPTKFKKPMARSAHKSGVAKNENEIDNDLYYYEYLLEESIGTSVSQVEYIEYKDKSNNLQDIENKYIAKLDYCKNAFLCVEKKIEISSINNKRRNEVKKYLKVLQNEFEYFIDMCKYESVTPVVLDQFVKASDKYFHQYIILLRMLIKLNITDSNITNEVLKIFTESYEKGLILPFYSPVMINTFNIIQNNQNELLKQIDEYNFLLSRTLLKNGYKYLESQAMPKYLLDEEDRLWSTKFNYKKMTNKYENEKYKLGHYAFDIFLLYNKIEWYVSEYPYKNVINVLVVGRLNEKNIYRLMSNLRGLINSNDNLAKFIKITIINDDYKTMRKTLLDAVDISRGVSFSFRKFDNKTIDEYLNDIRDSDLSILIDLMDFYKKPAKLLYETKKEINTLEFTELWYTMHNLILNESGASAKYSHNNVNDKNIAKLYGLIDKVSDKAITLISKDENFSKLLNYQKYCQYKKYNQYTDLTINNQFSNNDNSRINQDINMCYFSLYELINSISSDEYEQLATEIVDSLSVLINPLAFLRKLFIYWQIDKNECIPKIAYNDGEDLFAFTENDIEIIISVVNEIMKIVFMTKELSHLRGICVDLIYSNLISKKSVLLINYLRLSNDWNDFCVKQFTYDNIDKYEYINSVVSKEMRHTIEYIYDTSFSNKYVQELNYNFEDEHVKHIFKNIRNMIDSKYVPDSKREAIEYMEGEWDDSSKE